VHRWHRPHVRSPLLPVGAKHGAGGSAVTEATGFFQCFSYIIFLRLPYGGVGVETSSPNEGCYVGALYTTVPASLPAPI
jgi:hypothetical protein